MATPLKAPFGENIAVLGVNGSGELIGSYRPTGFAHGVVYRDGAWYRLPESAFSSVPEDTDGALVRTFPRPPIGARGEPGRTGARQRRAV